MTSIFFAVCAMVTQVTQADIETRLELLKGLPAEQLEAAKQIISRGGYAWPSHTTGKPPVELITLFGDTFTDAQIELLWPFVGTPVKSLGICRTNMSSEVIALAVERFTNLEGIAVTGMPIGDSAFTALGRFRELKKLSLDETDITSDTLQHIRRQIALETLGLSGTRIDDAGLKHLEALPTLKWLSMDETRITSMGLVSLGKLTSLELLFLRGTNVDDSGLKYLSSLTKLDTLALANTKVTSSGMQHLAKLENLKTLYIQHTSLEADGLKLLQNMPKLEEVCWDGSEAKPGDPRRRFNSLFHLHLPANANKWSKTRRDAVESGKREL